MQSSLNRLKTWDAHLLKNSMISPKPRLSFFRNFQHFHLWIYLQFLCFQIGHQKAGHWWMYLFFFTEWSYSGSFCEKFDNLGWKKLLMAFCLGILCKNVHLFNVFSLILFIQIVSILRAQSSIINNTEESNPITTSKSCYICLRGVIKWEYYFECEKA